MGRLAAQLALINKTVPIPAIRALWIRTKWTFVDQLVAALSKLCDGETCFVPTEDRRTIGTEAAFAIELADGTPVIAGRCTIIEHTELARRRGMRIAFVDVTPESAGVIARLRARAAVCQAVNGTDTVRVDTRPTEVMAPLPPPESILPANPLTELTDDALAGFVDCELTEYDGTGTDSSRAQTATLLWGAAPLVPPREMGVPLAVAAGSDEVCALPRLTAPPAPPAPPSWLSRLVTRLRAVFARKPRRTRRKRTRMPALR